MTEVTVTNEFFFFLETSLQPDPSTSMVVVCAVLGRAATPPVDLATVRGPGVSFFNSILDRTSSASVHRFRRASIYYWKALSAGSVPAGGKTTWQDSSSQK
jgi:hypothetical protein